MKFAFSGNWRCMNIIIVFECEEEARRKKIEAAIKLHGDWGLMTSDAILLETAHDIRILMEELQPLLGPKDNLWMFQAKAPWSSHGICIVEDHAAALMGPAVDFIPKDWDEEAGYRR